jgi:GxxExxY protein
MIKEAYKYSELTSKIIGCAMSVHSALGSGFPEKIYQRALAIEFRLQGISFEWEKMMLVYYKGEQVGNRRVDFLVEKAIPVELKAISALTDSDLAQAINYLEAQDLEIGLLINFGSKSLEFKRVINNKFNQQNQNPQS